MKNSFVKKLRISAVLFALTAAMAPKVTLAMPSCGNILTTCGGFVNDIKRGDLDQCDALYADGSDGRIACVNSALQVWDLGWARCLSSYDFCIENEGGGDCGNGEPGGNP